MRNAADVQNLPRKPRVIFTLSGGFIFTCYFFLELETSIVPSTLSYWLYRPGIRTAEETMEKEQSPTSAEWARSHVPSRSLSQSNLTTKGWPGVMGVGQVSRRGNMGCTQVECNGFMNTLLLLLSRFSRVQLCATPETAAYLAPLSLGFSRQEYWSGLPFPSSMHGSEKWKWSRSVLSNSSQPHGLQPTRLLCPWDSPSKSTGVGCHCLLHCLGIISKLRNEATGDALSRPRHHEKLSYHNY